MCMAIPFSQDTYKDVFIEHLEELDKFHEYMKGVGVLPSILQDLQCQMVHTTSCRVRTLT
jgi:hypothetical protein